MSIVSFLKTCNLMYKVYSLKSFYTIGKGSVFQNSFTIRLDDLIKNKKYLNIGENSIIGGKYIFETNEGNISIGNNCFIGNSTFICNTEIIIEDNVTIAWDTVFYTHDSHGLNYRERQKDMQLQLEALKLHKSMCYNKNWLIVKSKPIHICKNAWIGMNCTILKGVTIGEGAVVGAGSVVRESVKPWTLVIGNPAVKIRDLVDK